MQKAPTVAAPERAAFDVAPWCDSVRISRASFYTLPREYAPRSVKIRKRRLIIESPADWLERIAAAGGVPLRKAA